MRGADAGLAGRLVDWMAENREALDKLMAQEGSRAIHEEFLLAESGTLPDHATRIARARKAGARAWMRHLAQAVDANWRSGVSDLPDRMTIWINANGERLEALALEEEAAAERRGASGDPEADHRDAELTAHARLFAEGLATVAGPLGDEDASPAQFARGIAAWTRANDARRRAAEREALDAWRSRPAPEMTTAAATAAEPDEVRVAEAAAVWAHVRLTAEALGAALEARPEPPA